MSAAATRRRGRGRITRRTTAGETTTAAGRHEPTHRRRDERTAAPRRDDYYDRRDRDRDDRRRDDRYDRDDRRGRYDAALPRDEPPTL